MFSVSGKRLSKELQKAKINLPPGISIAKADDLREWHMDIRVLDDNPLYKNEIYRLSFIFSGQYPIEAPEVCFIKVAAASNNKTATTPSSTTTQSQPPNSATQPIDLTDDDSTSTPTDTGARPIPIHPHIYTNGIICLDLLGTAGWSPVQSVESVCVSIQSMLTGNTKNVRPEGDEAFCQSMGSRGPNGWSGSGSGRGGGGGVSGGWGAGGGGRTGRGLRDVRFAYDDDTV